MFVVSYAPVHSVRQICLAVAATVTLKSPHKRHVKENDILKKIAALINAKSNFTT